MIHAKARQSAALGRGDSLSDGAAGTALLQIEYAQAGIGSWDIVHEVVSAMTINPVRSHPDSCSLYQGVPAVAFTLHAAQRPAFAKALATLDGHITTVTRHRLKDANERIEREQLPELREFDLISGMTGIGAYLLFRNGEDELLRDVIHYLVRLTEPISLDGETVPGWWTFNGPADMPSPDWPGGHGNLGIAHGLAGPLSLLAIAWRRGITVRGQAAAISRICSWLDRYKVGSGASAWWPGLVSRSEQRLWAECDRNPGRPSWCYGTPGLARAQQLAALALSDQRRQREAEEALTGCITDERQQSQIIDASLCHGWAGLLQTAWRAATDSNSDSRLTAAVPQLQARLEQHLERHGPGVHGGLLAGAAGVQLAQHTTTRHGPPATGWDACLLLTG